jgi:hypothetical protein
MGRRRRSNYDEYDEDFIIPNPTTSRPLPKDINDDYIQDIVIMNQQQQDPGSYLFVLLFALCGISLAKYKVLVSGH